MKIYKKILNLGYGICCLLPIILVIFACIFRVKNGESVTIPIDGGSDIFEKVADNIWYIVSGATKWLIDDVEWFTPFRSFNEFICSTFTGFPNIIQSMTDGSYVLMPFVLLYSEWVVLVSFFRLFGSVFGCMINFADRMLDKLGGTN